MAADERIITELIVTGAQQAVRQIESVASSTTGLVTVQESAGVRQREVYDSVSRAADQAAKEQDAAARLASVAAQRQAEAIAEAEAQATKSVVAQAAARTEARRKEGQEAANAAEATRQAAQRAADDAEKARLVNARNLQAPNRLEAAVGAAQFTAKRTVAQQNADNSQVNQGAKLLAPAQLQDRLALAQAAAEFTKTRIAMEAQDVAAKTLTGRLQALASTIKSVVTENLGLGNSAKATAAATEQQAEATKKVQSSGVTYLSVLSAVHAASFLATNQTFSLVGSFATLGLAFGKVGVGFGAVGLAIGGVLGIFGQLNKAAQQIQETAISLVGTLVQVAAGAGAAVVTAGAAGVQIAGTAESALAELRAFGGATTEQLQQVAAQAADLAVKYGVSAASVIQATSLFVRAGGDIDDAIKGATASVIKLQQASAGELSAAQAAILLSATLKQFNIDGAEASRVVDTITAGFQGSALSALGFQQAMVQAAPGAAQLNISLEDLTAALAIIGNELVKGTITGTGFKQLILDLINPSKQAKTELDKYGISIQDATGKIRPWIDIVTDLSHGLGDQAIAEGRVTEAARATALAQIFGSRAGLAANIITREGVAAQEKFRTTLETVSASNVVNVLLLPMNKQLEILKTTIDQVSSAFGSPLLTPIRDAAAEAQSFFKSIIPFAELLGQTISVVVSGQGFGQLQQNIAALVSNNALAGFLIELVNTFRNVRDVIVSQIVPAIQDFFRTIGEVAGESGRLTDAVVAFNNINNAIQRVGVVAAVAIRFFGELLANIIHNEGAGKTLRDTFIKLADAIANRLVSSLVATGAAIAGAVAIMPILARTSIVVAQVILRAAQAAGVFSNTLTDLAERITAVNLVSEAMVKAQRGDFSGFIGLSDSLSKTSAEAQKMRDQTNSFIKEIGTLAAAVDGLANGGLDTLLAQGQAVGDELAKGAKAGVKSFEDIVGTIPDILSNVTEETEKQTRNLNGLLSNQGGPPGASGAPVDTKAIDRANAAIEEKARDLNRRLSNINEDIAQKSTNSVAKALERLDDIFTGARDKLIELRQTTKDRIDDIVTNITERRQDRKEVDDFKQAQEDKLTDFTRGLDKQEQAEDRKLEHTRNQRQRDTEDNARVVDRQAEDTARGYERAQQAASRSFEIIQQARETAFDRAQDVESRAFERQQQAQSEARDFAKQIASAKTPEERTNLETQRKQAQQDTTFRQGQEDKLTAFRQHQEDKKREFTQASEATAVSFRQNQENSLIEFRRKAELQLLDVRRKAEDHERDIREGEEDSALTRRLAREDILTARRRGDALKLQKLQDDIENERAAQQAIKIQREANKQANKIIDDAQRQAGEVVDGLILQMDEQAAAVDKELRNVMQALEDVADGLPPEVLAGVQGALQAARSSLETNSATVRQNLQDARDAALLKVSQRSAVDSAGLEIQRPTETIPPQVAQLQSMTVNSLILPPTFTQSVANAVFTGIQQLVNQGIIQPSTPVDVTPLERHLASIDRFLNG